MERKKNEALGRPMLTKNVDMSVFVRTLVYEVRTAAHSVAGATARAGADASASVGVGAEATAAAGDGALVELVPVSMPDPLVDQPDPLTRSVPNPQLDQTELLPLSVLEQLPVLDLCETMAIVSGLL